MIMRTRHFVFAALAVSLMGLGAGSIANDAVAAGDNVTPAPAQRWSFNGPFGKYDNAKLRRGYEVYKGVCAACHSMEYVAFRNLTEIGYSKEEVEAIAAEYEVEDGPDDYGDMFMRPARGSDYFPSPFANENAARSSNNGALPPDLSLITKARAHGPDYLYALLIGYEDAPDGVDVGDLSYNPYFPGRAIAMAVPLFDEAVEYADGTTATTDQMARDVTHFLTWAAEPTMAKRKQLGLRVMLFMLLLTGLTYLSNKKVWAGLKGKKND